MENLKNTNIKDYDKNHSAYKPGLLLQIIYQNNNEPKIEYKNIETEEKLKLEVNKKVTIGLVLDVKEEYDSNHLFKYADKLKKNPIKNDELNTAKFYYEMLCVIDEFGTYELRVPVYNDNVLALRNPFYYDKYFKQYYGGIEKYHGPIEKYFGPINQFKGAISEYINFAGSEANIEENIPLEDYLDSLGQLCDEHPEIHKKAKESVIRDQTSNSNVVLVVKNYANNILKLLEIRIKECTEEIYNIPKKIKDLQNDKAKEEAKYQAELKAVQEKYNLEKNNIKNEIATKKAEEGQKYKVEQEKYIKECENKLSININKYKALISDIDEKLKTYNTKETIKIYNQNLQNDPKFLHEYSGIEKDLDILVDYVYYLPLKKDVDSFLNSRPLENGLQERLQETLKKYTTELEKLDEDMKNKKTNLKKTYEEELKNINNILIKEKEKKYENEKIDLKKAYDENLSVINDKFKALEKLEKEPELIEKVKDNYKKIIEIIGNVLHNKSID